MKFVTVYSFSHESFRAWPGLSMGVLFTALGIVVAVGSRANRVRFQYNLFRYWMAVGWCFASLSSIWTIGFFLLAYGRYYTAKRCYEAGTFNTVTGFITDFRPLPATGHGSETFTVGGKNFSYSLYQLEPGFNGVSTTHWTVRNGEYVRIGYYKNVILQVQVATVP